MANKKTRIQVSLSDGVLKAIDEYCEITGLSRSAYCSQVISQSILTTKSFIEQVTNGLVTTTKEGIEEK